MFYTLDMFLLLLANFELTKYVVCAHTEARFHLPISHHIKSIKSSQNRWLEPEPYRCHLLLDLAP